MQPQNNQTPNNDTKNQINLMKCNIHFFKQKQKALLSSGKCNIHVQNRIVCFNAQSYKLNIPTNEPIVRIKEAHYMTFIYPDQKNNVYTISIPANDEKSIELDAFLSKNVEVLDFYSLPGDSRQRNSIMQNCPIGANRQLGLNNKDELKSTGKAVGEFFGSLGVLFNADEFNRDSKITMDRYSRQSLGDQPTSKWNIFKSKCSELNNKMTDLMKPINDYAKKTSNDIGNKYDNSQNSVIKGLRDWSTKTQSSLNQGYHQAQKQAGGQRASYVPKNYEQQQNMKETDK